MPQPQPTISLPWIEPLIWNASNSLPTQLGTRLYQPCGQSTSINPIPSNSSRWVWATAFPQLNQVPDAVSMGLDLDTNTNRVVPVPVRLHDLPVFLGNHSAAVTTPASRRIHESLGGALCMRLHPRVYALPAERIIPASMRYEGGVLVRDTSPSTQLFNRLTSYPPRRVMQHWCKPTQHFWPSLQPNGVYVGFEFEALFPDHSNRREQIIDALFLTSDSLTVGHTPSGRGECARLPHLHVEVDGTVDTGYEIVTMPHMFGEPSTHEALTRIFQTLMDLGAHNRSHKCGMHMHMSRTVFQNIRGISIEQVNNILHRFNALVLVWCENHPNMRAVYPFFTGRAQSSTYAIASTEPSGQRYHHINWANDKTVEFRWPGPNKFKFAWWPCVVADICHAMVECTRMLVRQRAAHTGSPSARAVYAARYFAANGRDDTAWAMQSLQRVVLSMPDVYPYAYRYFFENPDVPQGFILL